MSSTAPMTESRFLVLAWRDHEAKWELFDGEPRQKPGMGVQHNSLMCELGFAIRRPMGWGRFDVRITAGYVILNERNWFVPDVFAIPHRLAERMRVRGGLERYADPMPFVAEVWCPVAVDYDRDAKLSAYKARGDAEIWFVHPIARYVQRWVRQDDGAYRESVHERGTVAITSLPGVDVDLDALFAMLD